ncbi:hypothetical protein RUM43_009239 [Polyplax serrata]|uniref:Uncharacterized protein n=1 Tax=Polyplax serrata TaxID=468196 RepID=A0AAN8S8G0_POLSC
MTLDLVQYNIDKTALREHSDSSDKKPGVGRTVEIFIKLDASTRSGVINGTAQATQPTLVSVCSAKGTVPSQCRDKSA